MSYNGAENWQTWNVGLWLGNDEGLYHAIVDAGRRVSEFDASGAEELTRELMPDGTPDMDGAGEYAGVDWADVAEVCDDLAGIGNPDG